MEKVEEAPNDPESEETEAIELILFQVSECYVYLIPPRKSAASYRADEWDVNKWAWEGSLKVLSKGEECIIRLEDKITGELYALAFLRKGELHPVEPVIDSSRYFVLRIEENIGGRLRHAFIGIGFRERTQTQTKLTLISPFLYFVLRIEENIGGRLRHAFIGLGFRERTEAYDFQAALHDHMNYLDKKKTAEEMEQHFQNTSSVDYSIKEGETLVLQMKNKPGGSVKSKIFEQGLNNLSLEGNSDGKESFLSISLPPPPPAPLSPATSVQNSPSNLPPKITLDGNSTEKSPNLTKDEAGHHHLPDNESSQDDDFGDFQAAG